METQISLQATARKNTQILSVHLYRDYIFLINFKLWSKFYRTLLRVKLRQERRKIVRGINYEKKMLLKKYPDLIGDTDYLQKVLEKKRGYRPPIPYHELIRQPLPNELPKYIVERSRKKNVNEDDQF